MAPSNKIGSIKTVALYARVSSEKQAKEATVASQVDALTERAVADGFKILPRETFVDDGYSGTTLQRPALERLRDRAADGGLDVLYVHSPDRLARRYAYQVVLMEELVRHGVSVVFLHGPEGQSAEDELLVQVQGVIAEYERAKIMERCRRGRLHKARTGSVSALSQAPYGYRYVRKVDHEPARFEVLEHQARVVRQIFRWLVEDQVSLYEITRRLSATGEPTKTGRTRWDRATVWYIVRNPAYVGQAAFGKTLAVPRGKQLRPKTSAPRHANSSRERRSPADWVSIPVPAIVSPELFAAAQEQLARNSRLAQRHARGQRYLLQGLLQCACCRFAFIGFTTKRPTGTWYSYYRCCANDRVRVWGKTMCTNSYVRAEQLDAYVWDCVRQLLADPHRILDEWTRRGSEDGLVAELKAQRDQTQKLLAGQDQTLRRLADAYEAGALELDELTARTERIRARIRRAHDELAEIEARLAQTFELKELAGRIDVFADRIRGNLDAADWTLRRQLIRTIVSRVEVSEHDVCVVYRVPGTPMPPNPRRDVSEPAGATPHATLTAGAASAAPELSIALEPSLALCN
jgi:site-specific DNA recombinase